MKSAVVVRFSLALFIALCLNAAGQSLPNGGTPKDRQASEGQKAQILDPDQVEILVFPSCSSSDAPAPCPIDVVYTLHAGLNDGTLEVFNLLHVDAEFPLPDLSAGTHIMTLPHEFYWQERDETFPDPMFFCKLPPSSTNDFTTYLWGSRSDASVYDYKPDPSDKINGVQYDLTGPFRCDDVGYSSLVYPGKRNFERRARGELPEVELLGVGFVEGTSIQCGRNASRLYAAPLRDVKVVSTASHDANPDMPVLKAARFTMPKEVFQYRSHIRIVGALK
jgi:hypothetical protein